MRAPSTKTLAFAVALTSLTFFIQDVSAAAINAGNVAKLPLCSTVNTAPQYDYIVGQCPFMRDGV